MHRSNTAVVVGLLVASSIVLIMLVLLTRTSLLDTFIQPPVAPARKPALPTTYPGSQLFADAQRPVLKRQSDRSTEYEVIGRFVSTPALNKDGEYTGQFAVSIGETEIALPVTLGRSTFTIFLGEHTGSTPDSASTYNMKTVVEAMPFLTLKAGKPAVIRLKTKIEADIDPQSNECMEYCQYLWKWLGEKGKDAESVLDGLIRGQDQPLSRTTMLFVTHIGFLQAQ